MCLARSDNAKFELNRTTFPVDALFSELLEEQSLIDPAHAYAKTLSPEDGVLTADRAMIGQMLRALLDNSVKYTPKGGTIRLAYACNERDRILTVSDTGIGMDSAALKNIFTLFYSSKGGKGTGLGLFICRKIIEKHGGRISVDSEPGRGTVFQISLPIKLPAARAGRI